VQLEAIKLDVGRIDHRSCPPARVTWCKQNPGHNRESTGAAGRGKRGNRYFRQPLLQLHVRFSVFHVHVKVCKALLNAHASGTEIVRK